MVRKMLFSPIKNWGQDGYLDKDRQIKIFTGTEIDRGRDGEREGQVNELGTEPIFG